LPLAATDVPLGVMRSSASALSRATIVAANGNRNAASDVGVATALLRAGLQGAGLNVAINLGSIGDTAYISGVNAETARLSEEAGRAADEADTLLRIA
jgi:methenyltetrahydrofolate cyclohydrolase